MAKDNNSKYDIDLSTTNSSIDDADNNKFLALPMSSVCGLGFFNADNWELFLENFTDSMNKFEKKFINCNFNINTDDMYGKLC